LRVLITILLLLGTTSDSIAVLRIGVLFIIQPSRSKAVMLRRRVEKMYSQQVHHSLATTNKSYFGNFKLLLKISRISLDLRPFFSIQKSKVQSAFFVFCFLFDLLSGYLVIRVCDCSILHLLLSN
jgi:hypothetical protein